MWIIERIAEWTTTKRAIAILLMLVLTGAVGYGMVGLEQATDLGQFETDSPEAEKLEFISDHFGPVDREATTGAQVVITGENVLSRELLIATIDLQKQFRDSPTINSTLADDGIVDVSSIIATSLYRQSLAADLEQRSQALASQQATFNETAGMLIETLQAVQASQGEIEQLHVQYATDEIDEETYATLLEEQEQHIAKVTAEATAELSPEEATRFEALVDDIRAYQSSLFEIELAYERGEIDAATYADQRGDTLSAIESGYERVYDEVLQERAQHLAAEAAALETAGERVQTATPSLQEQREILETVSDDHLKQVIQQLFTGPGSAQLLALMPTDYEPGSATSDARAIFISQLVEDDLIAEGAAPEQIITSQLQMASIVDEKFGAAGFVLGQGTITDEINRSLDDSLLIVIPFALLLVVTALVVAYRDILDILLGVVGILLVLVWTFGFMGWLDISFNQIFIAVPVLLIGLSIDYAIHVFMRQREQREVDPRRSSGQAMQAALAGLLLALVWVTATAVFGFLSNVISPIAPIREFGIVSAFGIVAALLIFGILIPALKITLDNAFERIGISRHKRAFGTRGGGLTWVLATGQVLAARRPWAVIMVALVLTGGGLYGASEVDTSFEVEDFIASEPAAWTERLPGFMQPGEYSTKANLEFLTERFVRDDLSADILIEGNVTQDDTLQRQLSATEFAVDRESTALLADGSANIQSPLSLMQSVARENEEFNETFTTADTSGDGVPDRDLETVYDTLFAAAPERAAEVIYRSEDGEYHALRLTIMLRGDVSTSTIIDDMRAVAAELDGDGLIATATGQTIVFALIEDDIFRTVLESLLISLVAVFVFLMAVYRLTEGSATLGFITLLPIAMAVAWILGTMYLLEIPFNVITGTITSLTIGLGVAYNIHMSERVRLELDRGRNVWEALYVSVTGTGGALLGSAATTVGGFGVLAFAIIPALQQFGIITAITILYSFLASVLILPSLLVLWLTYLAPERPPVSPPDRSIERTVSIEEDQIHVELAVDAPAGRCILCEIPPASLEDIESIDPDPVDVCVDDEQFYVLWELDAGMTCLLEYTITHPAIDPEALPTFQGTFIVGEDRRILEAIKRQERHEGVESAQMPADPPSNDDIREVAVSYLDDEITRAELEAHYERWLGLAPDAIGQSTFQSAKATWQWPATEREDRA